MGPLEITFLICAVVVVLAIFGPGAVKRVDKVIDNKTNSNGKKE